jgi:hypothetical protein
MGSDEALAESGTPFSAGTAYYKIGIFGSPSTTTQWMLECGRPSSGTQHYDCRKTGRTYANPDRCAACSLHIQRQDGASTGRGEKAFALLDAFDETQRKQAILNYQVNDLMLGPGHAGQTIQPEGLKASAVNYRQQTMLLAVIAEWAGIINDAYATPHVAGIKSGLDDTYFAWSGPTTHQPEKTGVPTRRGRRSVVACPYHVSRSHERLRHKVYEAAMRNSLTIIR